MWFQARARIAKLTEEKNSAVQQNNKLQQELVREFYLKQFFVAEVVLKQLFSCSRCMLSARHFDARKAK